MEIRLLLGDQPKSFQTLYKYIMKKTILFLFVLTLSLSGYSQYGQNQRQRPGQVAPQANREPSEREIAEGKRKAEERKQEYISNFLSTLEADEFQKEITRQYLDSYWNKKIELLKVKYDHSLDREAAIKQLDDTHFKELEGLISEADMTKIKGLISGDFDEKEVKKKKRKKKKKKKN